ncbi:MAG TPA: hypothetical protein VGK34_02125, partial [Armatimonadota bacterium]
RAGELQKLQSKLPDLTPEELEVINRSLGSIINRIYHQPFIQIKEYAASGSSEEKLRTACEIFGIDSYGPDGGELAT